MRRALKGYGTLGRLEYVNERLKKLAEVNAEKLERQRIAEEKRRAADVKKAARETLDNQWRSISQWKVNLQR